MRLFTYIFEIHIALT